MTRAVAVAAAEDVDCWAANVVAAAVVDCWAAKNVAVAATAAAVVVTAAAVVVTAAAVATNANRPAAAADCSRADENVVADVAALEKIDVHVCRHLLPRVHRRLAIVHLHRLLAIVHPQRNLVVVVRLAAVVDVEAAAEEYYPRFSPVNVAAAIAVAVDVASRPMLAAVQRLPNANDGLEVVVDVASRQMRAAVQRLPNASDGLEVVAVVVAKRQITAAAVPWSHKHLPAEAAVKLTAFL